MVALGGRGGSHKRGTPITRVGTRQAAGPDIGAGTSGGGGRGAETPDGKGPSTLHTP